jgi:hypothetical protein
MYDVEVETMECLQALGYDVSLPSRQRYVDTYYSFTDTFDLLQTQVMNQTTTREQREAANIACPPAGTVYDPWATE